MVYPVALSHTAQMQLRHLAPDIKRQVRAGLRVLGINPRLGKPLEDKWAGFWRYRAHRYRIIYRMKPEQQVDVVLIAHRRDVYEISADAIRLLEHRARYTAVPKATS